MQALPAWLRLMRPNQWAKNLFVFAPALFSGQLQFASTWGKSALAFVFFCASSALVYCLNDYLDVEADRAHSIKRLTRPIASGEVSMQAARWIMAALFALLVVGVLVVPVLFGPLVSYLVINLIYNLGLRGIPVIDLVLISLGFVARVWAGAAILQVPLTGWIIVDTFFLALYLATMKRRNEFRLDLGHTRKSLRRYSRGLINFLAIVSLLGALVSYLYFTFEVRPQLTFTGVFVLLGLWRFWILSNQLKGDESPTDALVRDWPMITISALWATACYLLLVLWR